MFAGILQRPQGRYVGSSGHCLMVSGKGVSRTGWAQSADRRPESHRSNFFKPPILLWIRWAWRSRTFGTPPARVHSCENVWSLNLCQSAIIWSWRLECVWACKCWTDVAIIRNKEILEVMGRVAVKLQVRELDLEDQTRWWNWVVSLYILSTSTLRSFKN
jgi:hypothetical protein